MKTKLVSILGFAFALTLAGCMGSYFTWDKARLVKVGMTEAQVTRAMGGPPYMVQSLGNKKVKYIYAYGTGLGGSGSFTVMFQDGVASEVPEIPVSFK